MPGKIADMCEMRSRIEVEEIVRSECYEALEELSGSIIPINRQGKRDAGGGAEIVAGGYDENEVT
jgi:hypothetical protein